MQEAEEAKESEEAEPDAEQLASEISANQDDIKEE